MNADKTKYMCFNQRGDISTLNDGSLKLVDKTTNLGSSISSMKNDINERLAKIWRAIDRLSVMWKSDLSDQIKSNFFFFFCKQQSCPYYYMDVLYGR